MRWRVMAMEIAANITAHLDLSLEPDCQRWQLAMVSIGS